MVGTVQQCCSLFQAVLFILLVIKQSSCSTINRFTESNEPLIGLRITQGKDVPTNKFPSQVSLQNVNGVHVCGGSILNSRFVVSAAHCFLGGTTPHMIRVVTGTVNLKSPGRAYGVSNIIIHKNFSKTFNNIEGERIINDIALLKVVPKFSMTEGQDSIKFPPENRVLTGPGYVIGWGQMSDGRKPMMLQEASVKIIDDHICDTSYYGGEGVIKPQTQVCAVGNGAGACRGDSGGPLFLASTGEQVGIVSFGTLPCGYGPTVFTQLSSYREWILANIGETRLHFYNDDESASFSDISTSSSSEKMSNATSVSDSEIILELKETSVTSDKTSQDSSVILDNTNKDKSVSSKNKNSADSSSLPDNDNIVFL